MCGFCAQKVIEAADHGSHPVSAAFYVSFGDDWHVVQELAKEGSVPMAVETGAAQFAAHVREIEAGHFPPKPDKPSLCSWCAYALVCRKEVIDEDDDAAEPV